MVKRTREIDYNAVYESLGIEEDNLPDLRRHYERIRNSISSLCYAKWGTPERYVNALFWMRFVKKYDWYEIADILGSDYISVRVKFLPFGWDNNLLTYEECETKLDTIINTTQTQINQMHLHPEVFQEKEYLEKESKVLDSPCKLSAQKTFHVSTQKELFKVFYYLLVYLKKTNKEIALYYNTTPNNLRGYFNKFDIALTRKESCERREANGDGNHAQCRASFQKQLIRKSLVAGLSNNYELLFRDLLSSCISDFIDVFKYEVIIGVQTSSIIPPHEIDIPVLIINKENKNRYKYAIELDGKEWHTASKRNIRRDAQKSIEIEDTEWKLITIVFDRMTPNQDRIQKAFFELTRDVCSLLLSDLKELKASWKKKIIEVNCK